MRGVRSSEIGVRFVRRSGDLPYSTYLWVMSTRYAAGLFYVAPGKALTAEDIQRALGINDGVVLIHVAASSANVESVPQDSILVLDPGGSVGHQRPPTVASLAGRDVILVLEQQSSVPVTWLDVVRHPSVQVMRVPAHHEGIHPYVAMALRARVTGIRDQLVEAVIAQHRPLFANMEPLVRVVLNDPWGVRSPLNLATAMGLSIEELSAQLPGGVSRPEHFITLVRWVAFERLIGPLGVRPRRALFLVGVRDRSNLRRQWRRAAYLLRETKTA